MTIVNSSLPAQPKKRDSESLILLTAIGLSLAVTLGVAFSATATGTLQSAISAVSGFGNPSHSKLTAEVDLQGGAITELNQALRSVRGQVAMLNANDGGELGAAAEHRFARLDADITALTARIEALSAARDEAVANKALSGQVAGLETGLSFAELEIGALRSSLNGKDDKRGKEIAAIASRLERLETIVNGRDVTSSLRKPLRKRLRPVARAPKIAAPEYMMVDGVVRH
jgi:hypothetical protein